ncbi:AraC family transcriptional regulator [Aquimarina aquimarini]|uniref:AraC family transcriptional regulator n=1 Tax=Aquimarina aquimarini TaxID=1191734 RepID=UPI000D552AE6|nr:AraC family transcriptional regulator [Aquimarina aquimarini]
MEKPHNIASHAVCTYLENLELLMGTFTTHNFKPHFHESYTVILIDKGIGDYSNSNSNLVLSSGSILVFNPYEVHTGKAVGTSPWSFLTMYIPVEIMKKALVNIDFKDNKPPYFSQNIIENKILYDIAKFAFYSLLDKNKDSYNHDNLIKFLELLVKEYGTVYEKNITAMPYKYKVANEIRKHIHKNYLNDVSLEYLSSITGLKRDGVIKTFKQYYDLPPRQYILNLRIEKAKKLLLKKISSTEVAHETGFFDQSHFIKNFKKVIGVTPKKYASIVI